MGPRDRVTRATVVEGGPILVDGPLEVELPDGTVQRSDRPVVALCACRRSKRFPFCDTSHRARSRPDAQPTGSAARSDERPAAQDRSS